jgi:hypothetical protein
VDVNIFAGCISSEYFQPHMTPLMLACIGNNFAITSCLLLRNHAIDLPHFPDCNCLIYNWFILFDTSRCLRRLQMLQHSDARKCNATNR